MPDATKRLEAADDRLPASCLRFARSAVAQSRLLESVDIAFEILGPLQRQRLYRGDSRIRGEAEKFGERCLRFVEATELAETGGTDPIGAWKARILAQRRVRARKPFFLAASDEEREAHEMVIHKVVLGARAQAQRLAEGRHGFVTTSR